MATALKFDELNNLNYRDYFGSMFITPKQMQRRINLAEDIEDVFFVLLAYYAIYDGAELEIEQDNVLDDAKAKLTSVVEKHMRIDPYIQNHINTVIDEVSRVTEERIQERNREDEAEEERPRSDDGFYWTSYTRAMYISANEANAFENYNDYRDAKANGKTKKRWITELDDRVRFTHQLAEGETVDIDGLFLVGGSFMRFPKDAEYDPAPQEVINCRCSVEYL